MFGGTPAFLDPHLFSIELDNLERTEPGHRVTPGQGHWAHLGATGLVLGPPALRHFVQVRWRLSSLGHRACPTEALGRARGRAVGLRKAHPGAVGRGRHRSSPAEPGCRRDSTEDGRAALGDRRSFSLPQGDRVGKGQVMSEHPQGHWCPARRTRRGGPLPLPAPGKPAVGGGRGSRAWALEDPGSAGALVLDTQAPEP